MKTEPETDRQERVMVVTHLTAEEEQRLQRLAGRLQETPETLLRLAVLAYLEEHKELL